MNSNVRQEFRSPAQRRECREDYLAFLEASRFYPDVFRLMVDKVQEFIDAADPAGDLVLQRGHF